MVSGFGMIYFDAGSCTKPPPMLGRESLRELGPTMQTRAGMRFAHSLSGYLEDRQLLASCLHAAKLGFLGGND
jgi:hypothetical protein